MGKNDHSKIQTLEDSAHGYKIRVKVKENGAIYINAVDLTRGIGWTHMKKYHGEWFEDVETGIISLNLNGQTLGYSGNYKAYSYVPEVVLHKICTYYSYIDKISKFYQWYLQKAVPAIRLGIPIEQVENTEKSSKETLDQMTKEDEKNTNDMKEIEKSVDTPQMSKSHKGNIARDYFVKVEEELENAKCNIKNPNLNSNTQIQIFTNEEFGQVRTMLIDGEPWFVGKDVAEALGYSNARDAISKHVDGDDKGVAKCDTPGGKQNLSIINESGMYALVFGSKLDSAKKFKHWVTSEVLPSIRKTGSYSIINRKPDSYTIEDPAARARRWAEEYEEKQELQNQNVLLLQENEEMKPKAEFYDTVGNSDEAIKVADMAALLEKNPILTGDRKHKISSRKLFDYLYHKKYLCTYPYHKKPSQKMIDKEYMIYKEGYYRGEWDYTPYITGKGQIFLQKMVAKDIDFFLINGEDRYLESIGAE